MTGWGNANVHFYRKPSKQKGHTELSRTAFGGGAGTDLDRAFRPEGRRKGMPIAPPTGLPYDDTFKNMAVPGSVENADGMFIPLPWKPCIGGVLLEPTVGGIAICLTAQMRHLSAPFNLPLTSDLTFHHFYSELSSNVTT